MKRLPRMTRNSLPEKSYVSLILLFLLPAAALARPVDESGSLPKIKQLDTASQPGGRTSAFSSAQSGTTYYGGTYWAADSARWEALEDSCWTFDTGVGSDMVGSSSNPDVNPFKQPGLHATMEGWTGFDRTFIETTYFRRITDSDPRWGLDVCVGAAAGLEGSASFWAGVFPDEATELCFVTGQGYGNSWFVCIGKTLSYTGGVVGLAYDYSTDTEPDFDFVTVLCDTSGAGDLVEITAYDGTQAGRDSLILVPGNELPSAPGDVIVRFCLESDGAWSDEDGFHPTSCGAFAVDNISLAGGIVDGPATFETGEDGWSLLPPDPGMGGDWSNIVALSDLPPWLTPCACALDDSVLVFDDLSQGGGKNEYVDNLVASPWIDLGPQGYDNQGPIKFVQTNLYAELPLLNFVFVQFYVQWYPAICPTTGKMIQSPWTYNGFVYFFGGVPQCTPKYTGTSGTQVDFSAIIPPGAEQVRIAVGVISYCRFFANCTGVSNSTPWFDYVKLGVAGNPGAPVIATSTIDRPQDSFPQNGTLNILAPGRIDANNVIGSYSPEQYTSLGDTLLVQGGTGGAEVYVQFSISPGPGTDPVALNNYLGSLTFEETREGRDWYSARMDTAENRGRPISGTWMTARIEGSLGFVGHDGLTDPDDLDPNGNQTRLLNDIFLDNLLTMGSRLSLFYKTRFVGGTSWFTEPDTTGGNYLEMEVLPSSMGADSTANCVLYVDHFDGRGAQGFIENALTAVLGTGSSNYEGTTWDRYDVRAPSSQQASLGRPLNTQYGATLPQLLGYSCIIWNSGNLDAFNLTKEDADILIPWMTLAEFEGSSFYGSGNGLVASAFNEAQSEPSARRFFEDIAGVGFECNTYRELNCPLGEELDLSPCIPLDPAIGSPVAGSLGRLVDHEAHGNGCPQLRSFDVLLPTFSTDFGIPSGDETYNAPVPFDYSSASVVNDANLNSSLTYRTVVDGVSVHYRRDASGDCSFTSGTTASIEERFREVLTWLGHEEALTGCPRSTGAIGIETGEPTVSYNTTLGNFAPNPMVAGRTGSIQFSLKQEGPATIEVFDVRGRRVTTLHDGVVPEGVHEVFWNGTNDAGQSVSSGVYFYRLAAGGQVFSKKLVVVGNSSN